MYHLLMIIFSENFNHLYMQSSSVMDPGRQQQQQDFFSPHNIQEIKIYNNSTEDDRGAGCPK